LALILLTRQKASLDPHMGGAGAKVNLRGQFRWRPAVLKC